MNSEVEGSPDYLLKIVIVGDSGVGKSQIMCRFTNDQFDDNSKTTIGVAFATKNISIDPSSESDELATSENKKNVKLQVWDTAGQERYRALSSAYYRGAQGAFVVYDITSRQSLDSVPRWLEEIDKYCTQDIVVTLVGNKLDLATNRCVSVDEGRKLAATENMFFIETSAKDSTNIERAFIHLTKEIIRTNLTQPVTETKKKPSVTNTDTIPLQPQIDQPEDNQPPPPPSACTC